VEQLRKEVAAKGWIVMALYAKEVDARRRLPDDDAGQADLYLMRPDASQMRNITNTPDRHEFFPRFSPDGKKIMYRRLRKSKDLEHDGLGAQGELVIANSDGSNPVAYGKNGEYPWATWSPDTKQLACLEHNEGVIRIYDFETRKLLRQLPSHGIFQQMFWSPDGKKLCGTADVNGVQWCIVSLDLQTQETKVLTRHMNCTPNWFKDGSGIVNSCRNTDWGKKGGKGEPYGNTVLMQATVEGPTQGLLYADIDGHVYNGFTSPDDKYVAFNLGLSEGGTQGNPGKHRCFYIMRRSDAPIIQPGFKELSRLHPGARTGPVLQPQFPGGQPLVTVFVAGDWTYAQIGESK
jgi:Tol biopolymer transport system component